MLKIVSGNRGGACARHGFQRIRLGLVINRERRKRRSSFSSTYTGVAGENMSGADLGDLEIGYFLRTLKA